MSALTIDLKDLVAAYDPVAFALVVFAVFLGAAFAGRLATGFVLTRLRRQDILDHPNERSSHEAPTPRGGGWGILLVAFPIWIIGFTLSGMVEEGTFLMFGAALLAAVSWIDDLRTISAKHRLAVQIVAVLIGLIALAPFGPVTQGFLPLWADRVLVAIAWLWFLNLYNFMDGIDGLAGVQTTCVGAGIAAVIIGHPLLAISLPTYAWMAAGMAGAAAGFLMLNWHPAKLFMGDVGSVPIGFLLAWMLFALAASGHLLAAIILPLYFCVDATYTLLRRISQGKRPWEAHREHFYQRAVQRGLDHATVSYIVLFGNILLMLLAMASKQFGIICLAAAVLVVLGTILTMRLFPPQTTPPSGM
ncbi:MAG: glycosyltransferase family 4 protein [Alphaproteobacteria bacterium]|nr:glycosyltransferase family 4 protein [Alphaproteobacteria bacterium SS10]